MKSKATDVSIDVLEIKREKVSYCILGTTPTICARMSEKAGRELLLPRGRKSAAEKASSLKHVPRQEFRDAPYLLNKIGDDSGPTYIACLATQFKNMIASAALDIPGATKSQIGRLMWVEGERLPLWGVPQLHMAITRSADINRTPDVRTRCIVTEWATQITVSYMVPILKEKVVTNLLAAAGLTQGLGDYRPQKGKGTYGQFQLVSPDDPEFQRRMKFGREAQLKMMEKAVPYDDEADRLLAWWDGEVHARGFEIIT
jgi:hypothetical protein